MNSNEILKKIWEDDDFESGIPVTDEQVSDAEKKLGVEFVESYRKLIKEYGYISWSGGDVFGISNDQYFDTASRTAKHKEMKRPKEYDFPLDGNIISMYAGGGFYWLYGENATNPGVVIECLDETYWKPERRWDSLDEYLEYLFVN